MILNSVLEGYMGFRCILHGVREVGGKSNYPERGKTGGEPTKTDERANRPSWWVYLVLDLNDIEMNRWKVGRRGVKRYRGEGRGGGPPLEVDSGGLRNEPINGWQRRWDRKSFKLLTPPPTSFFFSFDHFLPPPPPPPPSPPPFQTDPLLPILNDD